MATQNFTDKVTTIPTEWLNDVDALVWDAFGGATTVAAALTALGISTFAQTILDDTNAATARVTLGAAGSGANTDITSLNAFTANGAITANGGITASSDIAMSGNAAIEEARANITQHATTMDFWAGPNILDGAGAAVTITACANAPQAGARRKFYPLANTVLTHDATFDIDGNVSQTAAAGDCWEIVAKTTTTYKVHVTKEDGTAVVVAASGLTAASQAQVEAVTSDAVALTPLNGKYHPGVAKAWCVVDVSGGTPSLTANLNVASITDNGTGDFTINLTTALSTSALCAVGMVRGPSGEGTANGLAGMSIDAGTALSASALRVWTKGGGASGVTDVQRFNVAIFGDFA